MDALVAVVTAVAVDFELCLSSSRRFFTAGALFSFSFLPFPPPIPIPLSSRYASPLLFRFGRELLAGIIKVRSGR